jgi:hypothetical protein
MGFGSASLLDFRLTNPTPLRPSETRFRQAIRASQANEKCISFSAEVRKSEIWAND